MSMINLFASLRYAPFAIPEIKKLTRRKAARKCLVDLGQGLDDSGRNESQNIDGRIIGGRRTKVLSVSVKSTLKGHTENKGKTRK